MNEEGNGSMVDDVQIGADHFQHVAQLAQQLRDDKIAVYSHRYDLLAFGSWMIEVGRRHRRVRIIYDGMERTLRASKCSAPGGRKARDWVDVGETVTSLHGAQVWEETTRLIRLGLR